MSAKAMAAKRRPRGGTHSGGMQCRGWATQLQAGVSDGGVERSTCCYLFDVSVQLTEAGLAAGPGMLNLYRSWI